MADYLKLKPFILKWEGGYANDPNDSGGHTNKGVTLNTYKEYCRKKGYPVPTVTRLRNMSDETWNDLFKTMFWDRWKGDLINSQSVANMCVDWLWNSGAYGIKIPQKVLGVKVDGIVGSETLNALNSQDPKKLFEKIKNERIAFIKRKVSTGAIHKSFLNGLLNRINDLKFED